MKENCFDIGTIQAFLDGELASDRLENVARHLSLCDDCAIQLATAEEESAFAYTALEQEFNTLVPTQRLWTKINNSIESERKPFWQPILAFFRNPALATFATFLIVFGLFVAYLNSGNSNSSPSIASKTENKPVQTLPVSTNPPASSDDNVNQPAPPSRDSEATKVASTPPQNRKSFQAVNANVNVNTQRQITPNPSNDTHNSEATIAVYEPLPGEESYIKTIATLEKTVDDKKDEALKPSSRFAFEKDLALVNDAISKLREQVKKNPRNEAAKQMLVSSYQNKIDLLNSVNGKTELMASYR